MKKHKKSLIIFVEGATEEEFYKKLLNNLKAGIDGNRFPYDKISFKNMEGVSHFGNKAVRFFRNECKKNIDMSFNIPILKSNIHLGKVLRKSNKRLYTVILTHIY